MVVFLGTRKYRFKKGETRNKQHCEVCHYDSKWHLVSVWTWFDFIFAPLFPVSRKKFLICPMCEYAIKVNGKNKNEIMSKIEMDEKEYP